MERVPFSQRVGAVAVPQVGLQDMPDELRIALWNTFQQWVFANDAPGSDEHEQARHATDPGELAQLNTVPAGDCAFSRISVRSDAESDVDSTTDANIRRRVPGLHRRLTNDVLY